MILSSPNVRDRKNQSLPEREPALRLEAKEGVVVQLPAESILFQASIPQRDTEFHAAEGAE
jgi:hypothetical protein